MNVLLEVYVKSILDKKDMRYKKARTSGLNTEYIIETDSDGTTKPCLHKSQVWYPHEPMWQKIAESRFNSGLRNCYLKISHVGDYGIDYHLAASITKLGLNIGGEFKNHEEEIWEITVNFPDNCQSGR